MLLRRLQVSHCPQVEAPGQEAMMSEILARGPITCGMATAELFDYGEQRIASVLFCSVSV